MGAASAPLLRLAEIARDLGADRLATEAGAIAARVAEGRFFVACVGQFKRGKSTLLNALVGRSLLPTGIVPITTVPTVIRYGSEVSARVLTGNAGWTSVPVSSLAQYVSEEYNPENRKQVTAVEAFVPSELLAGGMCLVDTPGLGSVFAGNTAATEEFIPHIDAALVVVGADPPLSGDELAMVEAVGKQVSDIIVILNKADRITPAEREAGIAFARSMIEKRLAREIGTIYEVSALERLEHKHGPDRDWPKLVETLRTLARQSGSALAQAASDRGRRRIAAHLLNVVAAQHEALVRPLEQSEQRLTELKQAIGEAEQSLSDLGFLFGAEQQRLSQMFIKRRAEFLGDAKPQAHQDLERELRQLPRRGGMQFRHDAMHAAQEVARRHLLPWLEAQQREAEESYRRVAQRFIDLANEFLRRLSGAGVAELSQDAHELAEESGFRVRSDFYFAELMHVAAPASPFRLALDSIFGAIGAYGRIVADAHEFLDRLLSVNAMRVQGDFDQRVFESRRKLEYEIRNVLRDAGASAEKALERARAAQEAGAAAVTQALENLNTTEVALRSLVA
jgi:GTP-binding protein EngB required for normal cell division